MARAAGAVIEDVDGNVLIDLGPGIAVTSVGASAPEVAAAVISPGASLKREAGRHATRASARPVSPVISPSPSLKRYQWLIPMVLRPSFPGDIAEASLKLRLRDAIGRCLRSFPR